MLISYLEPWNLYCFMRSTNVSGCNWQFHWLGLVNMYLHAINYQIITSGLKAIAIFKTDYGWMDTLFITSEI